MDCKPSLIRPKVSCHTAGRREVSPQRGGTARACALPSPFNGIPLMNSTGINVRCPPYRGLNADSVQYRPCAKKHISLSGHPKDLSCNAKPRGFYLQPGGAQDLAW